MEKYHKIQSIYKRDDKGVFIKGEYSLPVFQYLKNCTWRAAEKVDGTNIRIVWTGEEVLIKGKTDNAQLYVSLVHVLLSKFPAEKFRDLDYPPMCLYGEGFGKKIQKGGHKYLDGNDFALFDVKIDGYWLEHSNIIDIAEKLEITTVPYLENMYLDQAMSLVKIGIKSKYNEDLISEGLVLKPTVNLYCKRGQRIIVKIKHKDMVRMVND